MCRRQGHCLLPRQQDFMTVGIEAQGVVSGLEMSSAHRDGEEEMETGSERANEGPNRKIDRFIPLYMFIPIILCILADTFIQSNLHCILGIHCYQ